MILQFTGKHIEPVQKILIQSGVSCVQPCQQV